jgi:ribosome-binding protein aMBF1 (putative translation factor)
MIKNQRQYRITKSQARKLKAALTKAIDTKSNLHPALRKAQEDALRSQLEELQSDLRAYEALQSAKGRSLPECSLQELPQTLIQARIAGGLSQRELAERLGLKEQQVQRYEATNYASASLTRVQEVAQALNLRLKVASRVG